MVYRVYSSWIKELDGEQVEMLNEKLGFKSNSSIQKEGL